MQTNTRKKDIRVETYREAKAAHSTAASILELLETPPEGGGEEDPIMQLMDVLVRIEQRLMRVERRLGIGSPQGD